jgi:hypothetical protein
MADTATPSETEDCAETVALCPRCRAARQGCGCAADAAPCCFFLARGSCKGAPCAYPHVPDNGVTPCSYGATCRLGHASRALAGLDLPAQQAHWRAYRAGGAYEGASPAARDATRLRSQLEPWPTAVLRARLVQAFALPPCEAEALQGRAAVMRALLAAYAGAGRGRRTLRVAGTPVRAELRAQLLEQLHAWAAEHTVNTRPSISAASYMILRSPAEFGSKDSRNAAQAAARIEQYSALWRLAAQAIGEADADFAARFTALAVTRGFTGSPHIDKQNTGPFYGLALGDFEGGELCVEVDAFTVAAVETKGALGKVDGRYPHWVAPHTGERFSLIYYITEGAHLAPGQPYFGAVLEGQGEGAQGE